MAQQTSDDDELDLDTEDEEALAALEAACGEPEDSDDEEWGECFCDFIGGCTDLDDEDLALAQEGSDDDDLSLTPSEEAEVEAEAEALYDACGEPEDSDDEEWGECFCDFIGGCTDLASDE